jgi:hypothetical protein
MKTLAQVATSVFLAVTLAGCVGTPVKKLSETKSGSPEVAINKSPSTVKAALVAHMIENGYSLDADTEYQVKLSRAPTPAEAFMIGMFVGNGYSTNKIVLEDTLIPSDGGTRIIGKMFYWAQFPFGRINQQPAENDMELYNRHQLELNAVKAKLGAK